MEINLWLKARRQIMKSKIIFKIGSLISLIGFYLMMLLMIFMLMEGLSRLFIPASGFADSFGPLEPVFAYFTIDFRQQPAIYEEGQFLILYFVNELTTGLTALLFFWFMYKLLKNIHTYSLFMYENVSVLFKLGLSIGILGTASTYTSNLILSKVLSALSITNAHVSFSNLSYIDMIAGGIVLIIIALALRTAVNAVEENRKTI